MRVRFELENIDDLMIYELKYSDINIDIIKFVYYKYMCRFGNND